MSGKSFNMEMGPGAFGRSLGIDGFIKDVDAVMHLPVPPKIIEKFGLDSMNEMKGFMDGLAAAPPSKRRLHGELLNEMIMKEAVKNCPKFGPFSRRLYDIPGNIHSFKSLVSFLSFGLGPAVTMANSFVSCKSFAGISIIASVFDFPFWVIPKHMGEVISHIDPPDAWDVRSIAMGFPAMLFLLPRGMMKGDAGEEIAVASVSMINQETNRQTEKNGGCRFTIAGADGRTLSMDDGESLMIVACLSESGETWHSSIPVGSDGIITKEMIAGLPVQDHIGNYSQEWVIKTLFPFVMTTLALMSAREEIAGSPEVFRKMAKGKDGRREAWTPRILGKNYRVVNEGFRKEGGDGDGRHVRTHWRRGHFRGQRWGPKNAFIKQILIDPVIVNPPEMDAS